MSTPTSQTSAAPKTAPDRTGKSPRVTKASLEEEVKRLKDHLNTNAIAMHGYQQRTRELSAEKVDLARRLQIAEADAKEAERFHQELLDQIFRLQAEGAATEVAYMNALKIISASGKIEFSQLSPTLPSPNPDGLKSVMTDLKERLRGLLNEIRAGR